MTHRLLTGLNAVVKATTGAPTTGTWVVGDVVADSAGAHWVCLTAGTPGTWARLADTTDITELQTQLDKIWTYTHTQDASSDTWVVDHGAALPPAAVLVLDALGVVRYPEIQHNAPDPGKLTLLFTEALTGVVYVQIIGTTGGGGGGGDFDILDLPLTTLLKSSDYLAVSQDGFMRRVAASALALLAGSFTPLSVGVGVTYGVIGGPTTVEVEV